MVEEEIQLGRKREEEVEMGEKHIHARMNSCMHTYIQTDIQTCIYDHEHLYIHT